MAMLSVGTSELAEAGAQSVCKDMWPSLKIQLYMHTVESLPSTGIAAVWRNLRIVCLTNITAR